MSGLGSVAWKQLTPTTWSWPDSMRARRAACAATSRALRYPDSTAGTIPPSSATSAISASAPATSSAVLSSTTVDPSNRSQYSSRSDS